MTPSIYKKRLFIGIPLNDDTLKVAEDFQKHNRDVSYCRFTSLENLHITLYFIGQTRVEKVPEIKNQLALLASQTKSFSLELNSFCFAPRRKPYMTWGLFSKSTDFVTLSNKLHEYFELNAKTNKEALPHITLARFQNNKAIERIMLPEIKDPITIEVKQIILWESILKPDKAEYVALEKFNLV